jgi:voltage-gated potassium channel
VSNIIWGVFVLDFVLEFTIAPRKVEYLKRSWLTAISLVLPALRLVRIVRVVRLLRVARAARSLRLLRVVTSLNRGLRAVGNTFARRGIGYVVAITTLVTFGGAAGMYAFENPQALVDANYLDAAHAADVPGSPATAKRCGGPQ